jgi:hypothetical protein
MSLGRVYEQVYPGQGKAIFWTCLVEVGEVHTHSPLAIGFLHNYNTCQPIRIVYLSDKPGLEQFLDLLM